MMLSLDTAYRSFGGEVEASSTPTICRLPDSRRHQLSAIALEATLRQTVTEAVATLSSLKRLSEISAKATYMQMAWGNRLGTPAAKEKQAILDEIDSQL